MKQDAERSLLARVTALCEASTDNDPGIILVLQLSPILEILFVWLYIYST